MTKAVIATVAEDRPGLVSELSELVLGLNLNIEDSRMTVLGGEFAVLMSVTGVDAALDELNELLSKQAADGRFKYLFRRTGNRTTIDTELFLVTIEAMDHPGIVHGVTSFFGERAVNIRELSTETQRAPHTGSPIFNLKMEIEVPANKEIEALREGFTTFCDQQGLDGDIVTS